MPSINRHNVVWTGFPGGPGLSTFWCSDSVNLSIPLATFFNAIKALIPSTVTWQIPASGDVIDVASGALVGGWSGGTPATIVATGSASNYSALSGAMVRWDTSEIRGKRRMKGRTFLVPVVAAIYDNGSLIDSQRAVFQAAATAFAAATPQPLVYGRPHKNASDGAVGAITGATVPDRATPLRSRRD